MTDLLSSRARNVAPESEGRPAGGRVALTAAVAGVSAAAVMLLLAAGVALAGWFGADAGRYGETGDAVRVGTDAWLLAHFAALELDSATITLAPLGLTVLCAYVVYRSGGWVARRVRSRGGVLGYASGLVAATTLALAYGATAFVAAAFASHPRAGIAAGAAFVGAFTLAFVAGGTGLLLRTRRLRHRVAVGPPALRLALLGGAAVLLLMLAAASFLVAAAFVADFGKAATVLSRLHADGPGGLTYTVVGLLFVPNAVLLAAGYLLGPGFAVGVGTVVSPTAVVLGPIPAFPLLAALPGDGATPAWTTALLGVPVAVAALGVVLAGRVVPVTRYEGGALGGLAAGLLAALALAALVGLAGGAAGPGRMAEVGAPLESTLLAALVSFGGGGLVGGGVAAWRGRRRQDGTTSTARPTAG